MITFNVDFISILRNGVNEQPKEDVLRGGTCRRGGRGSHPGSLHSIRRHLRGRTKIYFSVGDFCKLKLIASYSTSHLNYFMSQVQMPMDYQTEKHRGFAFVEFELQEDAQAAIDNMVRFLFELPMRR